MFSAGMKLDLKVDFKSAPLLHACSTKWYCFGQTARRRQDSLAGEGKSLLNAHFGYSLGS